ncbi:LutC/YkgG family protein [Maribrevibacterium harenarium]|nr:lactate utilization protein C [Maribrevibacterium harenarium]
MTDSSRLQGRDAFLTALTQKLGRPTAAAPTAFYLPQQRQREVFQEYSLEQLKQHFVDYSRQNLGAKVIETTFDTLPQVIEQDALERFDEDSISLLIGTDARFPNSGAFAALDSRIQVKEWQPEEIREQQIACAEQAQIGVVFAECALVESGTIMLKSSKAQGRSISLLPTHSIFVIQQSDLLPRITQACERLHEQATQGHRLPSCVNFISGPSSTADIELIKVVGVHGPISATYVILTDQ